MCSSSLILVVLVGALSELRTSHSFMVSRNPAIKTTKPQHPRIFFSIPMILEVDHSIDPNTLSSSGAKYEDVLSGLNKLYPPDELSTRNAISRTDGYWKYISKGEAPPPTLTYGEFDFLFFADLIDKAIVLHNEGGGSDSIAEKTFTDIGSGTGRLVLGAAALHPNFKLCKGLEILQGIHENAVANLEICTNSDATKSLSFETDEGIGELSLAPIEFSCGSFHDPYEYFGNSDLIFVFSTCFTPEMMSSLSDGIGRQCKPGTIVITTEYKLNTSGHIGPLASDSHIPHGDYIIELVDSLDGTCWLVGGKSTAHIQRVTKSLWDGTGPREKPEAWPESTALQEAQDALQYLKGPQQLSLVEFLKSQ